MIRRAEEDLVRVWLSPEQLAHAVSVAENRQAQSRHCRPRHGAELSAMSPEQMHRMGCLGEKAVSVYTGIPWTGNLGRYEMPDVGQYEVRGNGYTTGDLIVHEKEKPDAVFILALVGRSPLIELAGWIRGREAHQARWWRKASPNHDRPPAFYVPQTELWMMDSLPRHGGGDGAL